MVQLDSTRVLLGMTFSVLCAAGALVIPELTRNPERAPRHREATPPPAAPAPALPTPAPAPIASRNYIPIPPAPLEDGLIGVLTDARVSGEDRDAFYLAVEANRRAESGQAIYSRLRTTAGSLHRASFGRAQLTIEDHLDRIATLSDEETVTLGITRAELREMRGRGAAARSWYEFLVSGNASAANTLDLSGPERAAAAQFMQHESAASLQGLVVKLGASFARTTGLPASAIRDLAATRSLASGARRADFRARYERIAGAPWSPADRNAAHIAQVVDAMSEHDAVLARVEVVLGGDNSARAAVGHYLGVGNVAENLFGWHARAAANVLPRPRFETFIRNADPLSTRLRELANWSHAVAAVDGVPDLHGVERARMLTRIARCFHGAPARARTAFFFGDDETRPRATRASELEAMTLEYREHRMWSDDRVQVRFEALLEERGLVR
jgi:hypothetical protein